ncbi:MAG: hypothetical protein HYR55_08570 [Acidobacteria bacterium]|nr:hypothetical protein [Acidobacteriota bacterium]MBI3656378.1 hypothetical protein [Acidobacteriota bacterium]
MRMKSFAVRTLIGVALSLIIAGLFLMPLQAQTDELKVEAIIGLSTDLLSVSVASMNAKTEFARRNLSDRDAILERFRELDEWSQSQGDLLYERYKTTQPDYLAASAKYREKIQDYLNDRTEAREALEGLEKRMKALIDELETIMAKAKR